MAAPRPPFIGLTGAIASGKSAALAALRELGAATLSTDEVAHEILDDPEVQAGIAERWGPELVENGQTNRGSVGAIVFEDASELEWLESITHPMVARRVVEWRDQLPPDAELAVVEVPLLFEAGMEGFFDGVLVIVAGERRAEWLRARGDGGVEGRSGRQMTESEKADRATWVVENDGTLEDLSRELQAVWPRLTQVDRS